MNIPIFTDNNSILGDGTEEHPITTIGGSGGSGNVTADTHPVHPTVFDDEFEEATLSPQWTIQNAAVVTLIDGSVLIKEPGAGTDTWKYITETLPSAPWTFAAKIDRIQNWPLSHSFNDGIILFDGTKLKHFGIGSNGATPTQAPFITVFNWNSQTSFNASLLNLAIGTGPNQIPFTPRYFRIVDDGTNWNYEISDDGIDWFVVFTEAANSFLTPTSIGLGTDTNQPTSTSGSISCDWFRRQA